MYVRKCQKKLGFPIWCPVFQVPWMILRFTISCQKVASEWISSKNLKWFVEFLVVPKVQSWKSFDLNVVWKIFASPSSDSQGKFLKGFTYKLFCNLRYELITLRCDVPIKFILDFHSFLLHSTIKFLHFPITFSSFPRQYALVTQQFASVLISPTLFCGTFPKN